MARLDPLRASKNIRDAYLRYLDTTYGPADLQLRKEFQNELAKPGRLTKGPILQASPAFGAGRTLADLADDGVVHPAMADLNPDVFPPTRPLYAHQETAIRRVAGRRNTLVATGTGSGKTETFMLPVLDALLRERDEGTIRHPGVRALLLYPMNALANDQMARMRDLFEPFPELTFGQYVGTTEDTEREALSTFRSQFGVDPSPNELISRDAMKARPPHVLLTNFAMLEYLLLRPDDSVFFDGPTGEHWRFLVLDEIHVYDGAKGAELGMLLRRVRDRVVNSERGRLVCVGTSATLGSQSSASSQLVEFAGALFDEPFDDEAVVTPSVLPLRQGDPVWALPLGGAQELLAAVDSGASTQGVALAVGKHWDQAPAAGDSPLSSYLHQVLKVETTMCTLQAELERGPVDLSTLAARVFGAEHHQAEVVSLVELGIKARAEEMSAPLIPARYHLLVRSLEGGFLCLAPSHPDGYTRLELARHQHCTVCERAHRVSTMFETGACRRCGATYIVGSRGDDDTVGHVSPTREPDLYLLTTPAVLEEDEDELLIGEVDEAPVDADVRQLCTGCGALHEAGRLFSCDCGDGARIEVTVARPKTGEPLRRCISCGGRSTREIVLRFLTGVDAPVAVLAGELYQAIPASEDDRLANRVGEGRKLLSFADSRQDAAYFAPFLDRTYARNIQRHLILKALDDESEDEALRMKALAPRVVAQAESALVIDPDTDSADKRAKAQIWLVREALGVDRRQSLSGTGLVDVGVAIPESIRNAGLPPALASLGLDDRSGFGLVRVLLGTLVSKAALTLPPGVQFDEPELDPFRRASRVRLHQSDAKAGIASWLPTASTNGRLDFIRRVLERLDADKDPRQLLGDLWERWLVQPGSKWNEVLVEAPERGPHGILHKIDWQWIEFRVGSEQHHPYQCNKCAQVWWDDVVGVCPSLRCEGTLAAYTPDPANYFATLYRSTDPSAMNVEEHTAQLRQDRARKVAQRFIRGEVNVLSCSTTFELGVDVGEVQAVLLRNMPPSPANYVQRAGRAGRRSESSALVVTFAQRRPHDRFYYDQPERMIGGQVDPPLVSLSNDTIVRRHLHATAYAAFVRKERADGHDWAKYVDEWFMDEADGTTASERFVQWLKSRPTPVGEALERICPPEASPGLQLATWEWVDDMLNEDPESEKGWYHRAAEEATGDLSDVHRLLDEAHRNRSSGKEIQRLERIQRTLGQRHLISYLAQRKVLPKYGFPVDVVNLDLSWDGTKESEYIELDRDLRQAVVEFAPGNVVVASSAHWKATGLRKPPNRAFLIYNWFECDSCGAFTQQFNHGDGEPLSTCGTCGSESRKDGGRFVHPIFGFIGERDPGPAGLIRPKRTGSTHTYFGDYAGEATEPLTLTRGDGTLVIRSSRQGQLSVINEGMRRGFDLCTTCGRILDAPKTGSKGARKAHEVPGRSNRTCSGGLQHLDLGHYFQTDVVMIEPSHHIESTGALSAVAALVAGVSSLGIATGDVDGVVRWRAGKASLVLYDTVPGGAGHAMQLRDRIPELIAAAMAVAATCECGEDSSCYGCLRSYSNQRHHDDLRRDDALQVLRALWPEDG